MARAHYQMAIKNYNDRYVESKRFYFGDNVVVNYENYCGTSKNVNEDETEE